MTNNNLPVGTSALIIARIDNVDSIVLTKRGNGCRSLRGKWSLPGGGVDINEHPYDGVKREVLEEVNLHIVPYKQLPLFLLDGDDQLWMDIPYICFVDPFKSTYKDLKNNELHKFDDVSWFSLNALPDNMSVFVQHILKRLSYESNNLTIEHYFNVEKDLLDQNFYNICNSKFDIETIYERSL